MYSKNDRGAYCRILEALHFVMILLSMRWFFSFVCNYILGYSRVMTHLQRTIDIFISIQCFRAVLLIIVDKCIHSIQCLWKSFIVFLSIIGNACVLVVDHLF